MSIPHATAIVLQARMGSRRLRGKSLAPLSGRTVLGQCIVRLARSGVPLIVATTREVEDDEIVSTARRWGANVFRGSTLDVLDRYIAVGRSYGLARIVRATADNPAVDIDAPLRVLETLERTGADHVVECGMPIGGAVEAVTLEALVRAQALVKSDEDREHVTTLVRREPQFRAVRALCPGHVRRPKLRLTVDTPDDLRFMRAVYAAFETHAIPTLPEILDAADDLAEDESTETMNATGERQ
ncbi:MAG TPA: hypothetical protein VN700_14905 [Vicinamibacterales bacterium]|nr:hypothetical protein [Vicinamibacterales bacterium]